MGGAGNKVAWGKGVMEQIIWTLQKRSKVHLRGVGLLNRKHFPPFCVNIFVFIFTTNFILKIVDFHNFKNLPWGHESSHKKPGLDRFSRFNVYWIQTSMQTSKVCTYRRRRLGLGVILRERLRTNEIIKNENFSEKKHKECVLLIIGTI